MANQSYMSDNEAGQTAQVLRLPTAASRKVRQVGKWADRQHLMEALPQFTGEYLAPWQREEERRRAARRELMADAKRTPELALVLAVHSVLSPKQRATVKSLLKVLAVTVPGDSTTIALELIGGGA
ncbi:hypothetical protein ASD89_24105 [Caulobacter sp. Root656]|nr:hypothetical protein ASD89_24105 [Caulobacter sp. Root656]